LWFALRHGSNIFEEQLIRTGLNRSAADIGLLHRIPAEIVHQIEVYSRTPLLLAAFIVSAIWLFRQDNRTSPIIGPLKALVIVAFFNTFVMGKVSGFYYIYPSLTASAAAGLMAASMIGKRSRTNLYLKVALAVVVVNSFVVIYGPRLLAWRFQEPQRRYQALERDLRRFDFAGRTVLGSGPEWYAMERLGAHFEIPYFGYVVPDATLQDYVIVNVRDLAEMQSQLNGFLRVGEIGTPLPRVFGSKLTDRDYDLIVFRSKNAAGESSRPVRIGSLPLASAPLRHLTANAGMPEFGLAGVAAR
jgi:hypothetical protein